MAQSETSNVANLDAYRQTPLQSVSAEALKSGGGGDRFDPMEQRVAALEKGFERIEKKLDTLLTDVAEVKGQLKAMPSAATFGELKGAVGELKGRVDSLPTTAKVAALLGIAVAIFSLVTRWHEFWGFIRG